MKKISNLKQKSIALVISLALIGTWFVPSIISNYVPQKTTIVKKGEKETIKSFNLNIKFDAPTNWNRLKQESDTLLTYKSQDQDSKINVEVLSDSSDFKVTLNRYIKMKNRNNIALVLINEEVEQSGFKGEYFYVVEPVKQLFGKGVVLFKDGTFLSIISYGNENEAESNLMKILNSLEGEKI